MSVITLDEVRAEHDGWQTWRNDDGRRQGWSRSPRTFASQLRHALDTLDDRARLIHKLVAVAAAKRAGLFHRRTARAA